MRDEQAAVRREPGERTLRRRTLLGSGLAAGAAATAGCTGGTERGGPVRLRFLSLAWQQESIAANKRLVAQWNRAHPDVQVHYQQGSWDTVHDQLVTSFEAGEAPDIVHDASDDLSDFAFGGYLRDLGPLLPASFLRTLPETAAATGRWEGKLYGVPFLREPRVLVADRKRLDAAGVPLPTVRKPWTWAEFDGVARELSYGRGDKRRYGVAWGLKEPVSVTLGLSPGFGGTYFTPDGGGHRVRFDEGEQAVPRLIHDQVHRHRSAAKSALGLGGSDTLPGFFAGRYAMLPLGFAFRQQVAQQAPKGFDWVVLPAPVGPRGAAQGSSAQTLSVAYECAAPSAAARFIAHFLAPSATAELAAGDWLVPTTRLAASQPGMPKGARYGWDVGVAALDTLRAPVAQRVRGYPEWKDKIATPGFQEYYAGRLSLAGLRSRLVSDGDNILRRYAA